MDDARTHFNAGVALLKDPAKPRYEEAYREFKAAYSLSNNPRVLGNMGFCAMKLERDAEAILAYEQYLKEAPNLESSDREQIERDLLTLRAGLITVTVESSPAGAVLIDTRVPAQGEPISNFYQGILGRTTLSLRRGHHVIRARLAGYADEVWEFDSDDGDVPPHKFSFVPPVTPVAIGERPSTAPTPNVLALSNADARPIPTSVYVTGTTTLALGVASAVSGVVALSKKTQYNNANSGDDPEAALRLRNSGATWNTAADVLGAGALVGLVTTVYLYVARNPKTEVGAVKPAANGLAVTF